MALQDYLMSRPMSAVTPVMSSLVGAVRNYFEGLFPKGYFKDYSTDTQLPLLRRKRHFRPLTESQLAARRFPLLSVRVEPTADNSEFASGVSWWTGNRFLRDPSQLVPLLRDDLGLRYAGFEMERIVVRFSVSFIVETEHKGREVLMYLKRVAPLSSRVFLNGVTVWTEIPGDLLRAVWSDLGLGDGSDADDVAAFLKYMRSSTGGFVEQTVNSASGRTSFSFPYQANPLLSIPGSPSITVNRDGNVISSAQIDLPIELDLAVPMSYAYRQEAHLTAPPNYEATLGSRIGAEPTAYFGTTIVSRPPQRIAEHLQLTVFLAVVTGDPDPALPAAADETDLSAFVASDVRNYVDFLYAASGSDSALDVRLWCSGREVPAADWNLDLDTWVLTIHATALQYRQKYHLGVYCDLELYRQVTPPPGVQRPPAPSPYYLPTA